MAVLIGTCSFSLFSFYFYSLNIPFVALTISTILIFSFLWIGFSWLLVRLRLTKDGLKEVLLKDGISHIAFLPLLTICLRDRMGLYNPNIWFAFLFIIVLGIFFFLKMRLIDWEMERKRYSVKSSILPLSILLFFITFFVAYFSILSFLKHQILLSSTDLGAFSHIFWNTVRGRFLESSWYGHSFLGEHNSPILILLAPFYALWQDPRMLIFLQVLLIGLSSLFLYWIACEKLKDRFIALVFAVSYLLHPFFSRITLIGFYEISLAPLLLFCTFLALIKRKTKTYFLFAFLSLMIKEEMSLLFLFFGAYIFAKHNRKIGIITIAMAILWALLSFKVIIPCMLEYTSITGEKAGYQYTGRYQHLGKSLGEIAKNVIFHPGVIGKTIFIPEKIITLIMLFLPFGFFSLTSFLIFPAIPILLLHLLAYFKIQYLLFGHYSASILPFVAISAIYGFSNLMERIKKQRLQLAIPLSISMVIISLFSNLYFNRYAFSYQPFPEDPENYKPDIHRTFLSTPTYTLTKKERERIALFYLLKELIPDNAPISCGETWAPFLSNRKGFFLFMEAEAYWDKADYVLLDLSKRTSAFNLLLGHLDRFEKEGNFCKVFEETEDNDFVIWVRNGKEKEILASAERLLKERPDSPHTHFILSSVYYHLGMLKDSQKEAEETLMLDPSYYNPMVYIILGDTSLSLKEQDRAYFAYKKAAAIEPFRVLRLLKIKELYTGQGLSQKVKMVDADIERIVLDLKNKAEKNPNDTWIKKQLAFILANIGQYREAVALLKEILSIEPEDAWARELSESLKNFS